MLHAVVEYARDAGYPLARISVAHANLGRVEWSGARELVHEHAAHYGLRVDEARRRNRDGEFRDLLQHVEDRGKWPSPANRYCTSDHKRDPCARIILRVAAEARSAHPHRECHMPVIVHCMGLRAQESPARAKRVPWSLDTRLSRAGRTVYQWLPIHGWSTADVWSTIAAAGTRPHPAYAAGMPRLSCVFCIYANRAALLRAGRLNPGLLADYVGVEQRTGHTFKDGLALADIQAELAADPKAGTEKPEDWSM